MNFVFDVVGLAAEFVGVVGNLDRFALFVFALEGDLVRLGLPGPRVTSFEQPGDFPVPGVADSLDLVPRIETIGFGEFLEDGIVLLRLGSCCKNQEPKDQ